ncbi:MAG: WG repeat-containing protein, partial [Clostridiales bacterium]|nr:WG repeat-containing protein [Clostridiales bacterium]
MKREFLLMGLAVTLFCMPVFAKADTTLTEVAAVQDADWIDGTNLLSVEGDSGYGIMEIDGTMLTDMIYTYSFSYDYGYISAIVAGDSWDCRGVLNLAGEEVVPCQYTYADILNNHWALGYMLTEADASQYDFTMTNWFSSDSDTYLLINTVDVYYMEDHTASVVATLTRDQFMDAYAAGKYINIQDRSTTSITAYDSSFTAVATDLSSIYAEQEDASDIVEYYENGQYGLKDASGNIIMEPSYYTIYSFYGGYAMVSDGELYGLIDEQGNEVLPVAYEDVLTNYYSPEDEDGNTSGYNAFGYFAAEQDGKLVFVTEGGTVVSGPAYAVDNVDLKGASATLTDMEGNELLISADGIETSLDGYSYVYALYNTSGMLYEVEDSDYNYGVIDWHGNEVLPCAYKGVDVSGDGNYLLADLDYDNSVIYQISYDVTVAMDASSEMADDAETAEETETEEST